MTRIAKSVRDRVQKRANARCEYCHLPDTFGYYSHQVDHILPVKHHGSSDEDNLAWACFECNNAKGSDISAYDAQIGVLTPLYNPRSQNWEDHFILKEDGTFDGLSAVGRVTIRVLKMNQEERIEMRRMLILAGLWQKSSP
ncbi:MAG: HNH endonuclease [Anaerolineae bacterium]|nr:HNH endonuclease [Anaerolineae bacterium]